MNWATAIFLSVTAISISASFTVAYVFKKIADDDKARAKSIREMLEKTGK